MHTRLEHTAQTQNVWIETGICDGFHECLISNEYRNAAYWCFIAEKISHQSVVSIRRFSNAFAYRKYMLCSNNHHSSIFSNDWMFAKCEKFFVNCLEIRVLLPSRSKCIIWIRCMNNCSQNNNFSPRAK